MGKKKKKRRHGTSLLGLMRGGLYAGSLAAPGIARWQSGWSWDNIITGYAGYRSDKGFDWPTLAQSWTPFVAWSAVDMLLSKFGVWKRVGRAMKALSF